MYIGAALLTPPVAHFALFIIPRYILRMLFPVSLEIIGMTFPPGFFLRVLILEVVGALLQTMGFLDPVSLSLAGFLGADILPGSYAGIRVKQFFAKATPFLTAARADHGKDPPGLGKPSPRLLY